MSVLRALPVLLASALLLAACGDRNEGREPPATRVTSDDAAEAARVLGLEEPGRADWENREFANGVFRFENFTLLLAQVETEGGEDAEDTLVESRLNAEIMEIAAPRLEEGVVRFDRLTLENAVLTDLEGGETRFERLVIDRPGPALSRSIAASFTGETDDLPDLAANLAAYSFREMSLAGLSVSLPEGDGTLQAANVSLRGLDETGLELARVESISFDGPATRFEIENVEMERVGARFLASLFDDEAASLLQTAISGNPADYYRSLSMTGLSGVASGVVYEMDSFSADVTPEGERLRTTGSMPALRLSAERGSDPGEHVHNVLGFLGYEEVVLRFETDTIYDPATDTLQTQNNNRFVWEDGLTLSAQQQISGVQAYGDAVAAARDSAVSEPEALAELERLLRLHRLEIRLEDHSLLDRSFSAYAQMSGVTPAQMRVQASALIALGLSALPAEIPRPFINAISRPLSDFVRDGGTLIITLDPPEPVPLPALVSPSGEFDIDRLGLAVNVERPGQE
ncbi:hypothetical protein AB6B38_10580 [Glycocaulis abyssi]|uniref:Lipoprotein n=1 Tax=Glycocaulis abyssi TaxID=1433403 RepID=A0ABV9NBU3_9PROT